MTENLNIEPNPNHEPEIRVTRLELIGPFKKSGNETGKWHSFIYVTGGSGILAIDFDQHVAMKGKVFFIEKYKHWDFLTIDHLTGMIVQFTDAFYNHIYTGNPKIVSDHSLSGEFSPFIRICEENRTKWESILDVIMREYAAMMENSTEVLCLGLKILVLMFRRNIHSKARLVSSSRKMQLSGEFRQLVNNHFAEIKTPGDFAKLLNITPNYLNAVCKEVFDKTVSEIIQERVTLEAKRLLTHTGLSVSEIAYTLGYKDNSYFGRCFKKVAGVSPEKYRMAEYNSRGV